MSPVLIERFKFPLSSLQIMGSSLFSVHSRTDSSHGAMFPGTQTVTEALCVTFFSIFILCSKVTMITYGARGYPRSAEAIGFCHNTFPPPPQINRRNETCWKKGKQEIQGMNSMIWFSVLCLYILQIALNQGLVIWLIKLLGFCFNPNDRNIWKQKRRNRLCILNTYLCKI